MALNKRQRLIARWVGWTAALTTVTILFFIFRTPPADPAALGADGKVGGLTNALQRSIDPQKATFQFDDITDSAGINFRHFPSTRTSVVPEDMGSGLAWGDFDNDGFDDLYIVNFASAINQPLDDSSPAGWSQLYHNNGDETFTDITESAGLNQSKFGMGASWGDYNNDGFLDLYLTHYGANQLFKNNGNGTFTDVSVKSKTGDARFSAGASWADYNNDGYVDLYVTNYLDFDESTVGSAGASKQYGSEIPFTLNPSSYPAQENALFRNNGNGTFTDVAKSAGVNNPEGRSMGALWFDMNNDGNPDLYVANDVSSNGVYLNKGDGTFEDIGAKSLAADYRGAMGLSVGDIDHDADQDLFVTHWLAQENAFYANQFSEGWEDGDGNKLLVFMDAAEQLGLGQISLKTVAWATGMTDFDNDGLLDLWVVNGSTLESETDHTKLVSQPAHIFRQLDGKGFYEIAPFALEGFDYDFVGRGGAHADFNNDGTMDLAMLAFGEGIILAKNISIQDSSHYWIAIKLQQKNKNRFALGARIELTAQIPNNPNRWRTFSAQIGTENTYLSQNGTTAHFGLGEMGKVLQIKIFWPDGEEQIIKTLAVNEYNTIIHQDRY